MERMDDQEATEWLKDLITHSIILSSAEYKHAGADLKVEQIGMD